MEGALLLALMATQLVIEILFLVWTWTRIVRNGAVISPTIRDRCLSFAVACFTVAVAIHLYRGFGHGIEATRRTLLLFVAFSLSSMGFVLALVGRGKGRIVTAVASLELSASLLVLG
jgi:hypothetical protein